MGLTRIEYGSIASSSLLNDNFEYLGNKFDLIGQNISTLDARVSSVSSSLNNSINNLSTTTSQNLSNAVNTLNNSITPLQNRRYIVEASSKSQLPRWYRVWSDGWCEQGGEAVSGTKANPSTVTFLKPFTNVNYTLTSMVKSENHYVDQVMYKDKATDSFKLIGGFNGDTFQNTTCTWQASGYIS